MSDESTRGSLRERIADDYSGYKLYDERGEKIGKVDYTVLDRENRPEYLAVKMGLIGSKTTLVPQQIVRLRNEEREFDVQASEDRIKDAPTFGDEDDVTPDFEDRVLEHFGLRSRGRDEGSPAESATAGSTAAGTSGGSRDRDDDRREAREERSTESRSAESRFGAEEGRTESRGSDRGRIDREPDRDTRRDDRESSTSRSESGSGREMIRVPVKREKVRAERIRGEDGQEEVRVRKEMVEEEEMVEVEDRLD